MKVTYKSNEDSFVHHLRDEMKAYLKIDSDDYNNCHLLSGCIEGQYLGCRKFINFLEEREKNKIDNIIIEQKELSAIRIDFSDDINSPLIIQHIRSYGVDCFIAVEKDNIPELIKALELINNE